MLFLPDRVQRTAGNSGAQKVKGAKRFRSADAVRGHPVFALIGHQGVMGLQAKVAVHQGGVEAEILQTRLQSGDIVAVHRRPELVGECAGAQPVGRLSQRPVGRFADEAVDQQTPTLLEGAHRMIEFGVEAVECHVPAGRHIFVGVFQQPECGQRSPNLHHCAASVPATQHVGGYGVRSGVGIAGAAAGTPHGMHCRRKNDRQGNRQHYPW